jgi:glucose/arabinose dehydrogenase
MPETPAMVQAGHIQYTMAMIVRAFRGRQLLVCLLAGLLLAACTTVENESKPVTDAAAVQLQPQSEKPLPVAPPGPVIEHGFVMRTVAADLDDPWGMDFLADGSLLVTQRAGGLLRVRLEDGDVQPIYGVPRVAKVGQGGLLDVAVSEDAQDPWIYLSYSVAVDEGYTTRVARMRLWEDELVDLQELFTAEPAYDTRRHFGSRLLLVDDYLFFTVGDRANRHGAQDLAVHNGKVMRLYSDGGVPDDNPFLAVPGARPEIWTYGHRNPQGLARHPADGSLWVSEHGPQGGDEINRLQPGANYGWPVITYGEEYGGGAIGEGTHKEGMQQPLKYYTPSIGTAGIAFYTGTAYPQWRDSLLVAALRMTHISRVELSGDGLGLETRLFEDDKQRFRDVAQGPDGYIYALVGGDRLVKILPDS